MLRELSSGEATWTLFTYKTEDGLLCLDVQISDQSGEIGTVGSCEAGASNKVLSPTIGGVTTSAGYQQVLLGSSGATVVIVRITSAEGAEHTVVPANGVWIVRPTTTSRQWTVEAIDPSGTVIESQLISDEGTPR